MNEASGQIVTFYSYKGGVGRTMALANVAYLPHVRGKKILVMDWDLEAPGLAYYFKAIVDTEESRKIKDAPGVLDMLHDWQDAVLRADATELTLEELFASYEGGQAFLPYLRTIGSHPYVTNEGRIDYIGPGAKLVSGREDRKYADALARFSWSRFFDDLRGGVLLNYLRNWAKRDYDYVFIDSRTGYADVSGICTTQLPDTVALCFILNKQNIDGIARVAGSIATSRGSDVKMRPIPMRTAREGSTEESDAIARTVTLLRRDSGLSLDQIQTDLKQLKIRQTDGVPFIEGLANFYAEDPKYDLGTINYVQLANYLLGIEIANPQLDQLTFDTVRRRNSPKQATVELLKTLETKEPARAIDDLQRFLEAAIEDAGDDSEFSPEYQRALVDTTFNFLVQNDGCCAIICRSDTSARTLLHNREESE